MNNFEFYSLKQENDPRRDLLESLSPETVANLAGSDRDYEHAQEGLAAQIVKEVEIMPVQGKDGVETRIIVRPDALENALFLPQGPGRLDWESPKSDGPFREPNHEANESLQEAYRSGNPVGKHLTLSNIRVAMGTMYEFVDPADGRAKVAIRINNDPNNAYAGWGNTYSGLIKLARPGKLPSYYQRATVEEVIPAAHGDENGLRPFYPGKGFFSDGNWSRYKKKAAAVAGLEEELEYIPTKRVGFSPSSYLEGVSVQFDYANLGKEGFYGLKNVSASLTDEGTLEIQSLVRLDECPDRLFDPEFDSDIVVVDVEKLAQWQYDSDRKDVASLDLDRVIDGATGLPTTDAGKAIYYRDNFKASPPLANITRSLRDYYENRV